MSVEIGSYLRQARESMGLSLDQLQEKTKIQQSFLQAIEKGEFHKLPSPFYVRAYLRSYANCVKIEPHHILRQYRKEEQAERGLTGTHKVITESELAQALTQRNQVVGFTATHTALTIAESKSGQTERVPHKDDAARREFGYQRSTTHAVRTLERVTAPIHTAVSGMNPLGSYEQNSQRFHTAPLSVIESGHTLSRSARMKALKIEEKLPFKKIMVMTVSAIACLSLAWVIFAWIMSKPAVQSSHKPANSNHSSSLPKTAETASTAHQAKLVFTGSNQFVHHYQAVGLNSLEIKIVSPDSTRVQLRTNIGTDIHKDHLIKEVTLAKNVPWSISYPLADSQKELYLFFSKPQRVDIEINGQQLKATNYYIHIQKKE